MDFLLVNLVILLLAAGAGAWGIVLLVRKKPLKVYFIAFAATVSVGLLLRWVDAVPLALFGYWYWGIAATPSILVPLVQVVILACGAVKHRWRRAVYLGLLFSLVLFVLWGRVELLVVDRSHLKGEVDTQGVCRQSSGYTCGPACLAMLLHLYDEEVTEREVADACRTTLYNGTNEFLCCGYLRRRLAHRPELRAEVVRGERPAPPYLEQVDFSLAAHHWVLVVDRSAETGRYRVRDPLTGERHHSREEHESRSQRCYVFIRQ